MTDLSGQTTTVDLWRETTRPTARRLALDVGVAAAYTIVFGLAVVATSTAAAWVTVVLGVALAVRRLSVATMVVAAVGAAILQVVSGEIAVLADIAYAPLAFTLGSHPARGVRRLGLACAVASTAVAGLWTRMTGSDQFGPSAAAGVGIAALATVVVGGGWTAGYVRWQQRQALQARMDAALGAAEQARLEGLYREEQQRGRIAADMHDVVAHSWAVVAAQADGARYVLLDDPARAEEALRVIGETARTAMTDVRGLLAELRDGEPPAHLDVPVVDEVVRRMRQSGLTVELARRGAPCRGPVADVARYVLTESLTNALKHGDRGQPVRVVEDWGEDRGEDYRLHVANSQVPGRQPGVGHGVGGMADRVTSMGGHLDAGPQGGQWVVDVRIPAEARG